MYGQACEFAFVCPNGRLGDVLARGGIVCPGFRNLVGARGQDESGFALLLAQRDMGDLLRVALERGEHLVGVAVLQLDDLVVTAGEEGMRFLTFICHPHPLSVPASVSLHP